MDSIRVSEAPDPGSIPGEATTNRKHVFRLCIKKHTPRIGHCQNLDKSLQQYNSGI